jgi:hypothetical protein
MCSSELGLICDDVALGANVAYLHVKRIASRCDDVALGANAAYLHVMRIAINTLEWCADVTNLHVKRIAIHELDWVILYKYIEFGI